MPARTFLFSNCKDTYETGCADEHKMLIMNFATAEYSSSFSLAPVTAEQRLRFPRILATIAAPFL